MNSMINLKASKKTPTINVNVNPATNINVSNEILAKTVSPTVRSETTVSAQNVQESNVLTQTVQESNVSTQSVQESNVSADPIQEANIKIQAFLREISVLKLIIELQHSNPLIVNKYIITDDELLCRLIALLCNARDVQLDADDLGGGCLTNKIYRKVNSIYVVNENGETLNLKYDYPSVMKTLKDLHISVKYVF